MNKDLNYYLIKGFDRKSAEYFCNGRRKITNVKADQNHILNLTFDNGETKLFDVTPYLQKDTVFEFLLDIDNFNRVYVDEDNNIAWDIDPNVNSDIVWDNKVDISGDTCYIDSVNYLQGGDIMEETKPKRKTTTSSSVKRKYNEKTYDRIEFNVPKGDKEKWKQIATDKGFTSLSAFILDSMTNA